MKATWLTSRGPLAPASVALAVLAAGTGTATTGCGTQGDTRASFGGESGTPIPARAGSVVVEGCALDAWQTEQLASDAAHAVLQAVIFLCPTARDDGTIAPVEASARGELAQTLAQVRQLGYQARLALTMLDELDQPYAPATMQASLASDTWRAQVTASLAPFEQMADGIDLQLPPPPAASRDDVTTLVKALSQVRPAGKGLAVFVPPAAGNAPDVPGAGAYDLAGIGPLVDRVHVLTLDYSASTGPGPTIDSGWAVDVERSIAAQASAPLDVAFPLYGWDFGPGGAQRSVTYLEAQAVAGQTHASVSRGPTGALFYDWVDEGGGAHETWFDDGTSTSWALAAWDTQTLPADVGVVFWGLGAEDPALWSTLAGEVTR